MSSKCGISSVDKDNIRAYVNGIKDKEVRKERRKECAEMFGVSLMTIAAITATDPNLDSMNYDNPIKRKWREEVKAILPSQKGKKIFTMPGVMCHEIPMWLDLGADPKDITGVELKKPRLFRSYAKKYKINGISGDIRKEIKNGKWDTVCIDITGPYCDLLYKTLADLTCETLIVNYMCGREHKKNKKHIAWCAEVMTHHMTLSKRRDDIPDLSHISVQRENVVPFIIYSCLFKEHKDRDKKLEEIVNFFELMLKYFKVPADMARRFAIFIYFCWDRITKTYPIATKIERLGYKSPSRHVFLTEILSFQKPETSCCLKVYNIFKQIYDHLGDRSIWDAFDHLQAETADVFGDERGCGFQIRDHKNLMLLCKGQTLHHKDMIQFYPVNSFTLNDLMREMDKCVPHTDICFKFLNGQTSELKERKWIE